MKNIISLLNQLEQLLAQQTPQSLSAIERDILLEKLRLLYEKVLTTEQNEPACEEDNQIVAVVSAASAAPEEAAAPEETAAPVPEEEIVAEESVIELIEEIIEQVEELPETDDEQPEPIDEQPEPIDESAMEEVIEMEQFIEIEFAEEPIEEPLAEEEPVVKRKIDHKVVLSLYDDDEPVVTPKPIEDEPVEESVIELIEDIIEQVEEFPEEEDEELEYVAEDAPAGAEIEPTPEPTEVVPEPTPEPTEVVPEQTTEPTQTVVLGDVLGGEQKTVAEQFVTPVIADGVAGAAAAGSVSLLKSVGVNDKFILLRDLFGGDARLYEQSMEVLDSYESLDEAMLFIYDNFDWKPNSEGAKLLMELLSRKLL